MAGAARGGVVFDLDGTLVDSIGDLHAIAAAVLAEHGLRPLPLETVAGFVGAGIPALVERCFAAAGRPLDGPALRLAVTRYQALYAAAPAAFTRPYQGVAEAIATLQADGFALGVCTNKAEAISRAVLDAVGLGPHFGAVVGGDTLPVRKPDPAMLRAAAEALGVPLEAVIYVGDSETDAATAEAAGVPLLLFTRGYRKASVESLRPAAAFDSFCDLPHLARGLRTS